MGEYKTELNFLALRAIILLTYYACLFVKDCLYNSKIKFIS